MFGPDDYAGVYAEKGSQGMPTLRGFEVIGALAEISALSLNGLCGIGQYASIVDFCFLVYKVGLIMTTHTGLVRIKGGKYAVVTSSSPTQCDTSVTAVYSISLKGTSNRSITQAKTLGVLLAPLTTFIQSTRAPASSAPHLHKQTRYPRSTYRHLVPGLLQKPLSDFLAATFAPQQSICNRAAKLVRPFTNPSPITSALCSKPSNGSHLT